MTLSYIASASGYNFSLFKCSSGVVQVLSLSWKMLSWFTIGEWGRGLNKEYCDIHFCTKK